MPSQRLERLKFAGLSICLSVYLSIYLSVYLSIYLSIYLSTYRSSYPLSDRVCVCVCVFPGTLFLSRLLFLLYSALAVISVYRPLPHRLLHSVHLLLQPSLSICFGVAFSLGSILYLSPPSA